MSSVGPEIERTPRGLAPRLASLCRSPSATPYARATRSHGLPFCTLHFSFFTLHSSPKCRMQNAKCKMQSAGSRVAPASRYARLALYALLIPLLAFAWWTRVRDLDLEFALHGGGPMLYVYKSADPSSFAKDFPGGVEQFRYSAPMYLYRVAWSALGIAPERLYPAMVAIEVAFMAAAMIALTRGLRPGAPPIVGVVVAAMAVASGARDMSLAALREPFFMGLYHNIAGGLGILGILMALRGRMVLAAGLLGGSFMSHPAMGFTASAFALAPFAVRPRELLQRKHLAAGALFAALVGGWAFGVLGYGSMSGARFPAPLWFDLTRLNCFHLYPVDRGVFTAYHDLIFIPFLSFLVLVAFYLTRSTPLGEVERKVAWGIVGMLALSALGVFFSVVLVSTGLVKLALHRANAVILTVGLVYIVAGLWEELGSATWWRPLVAGIILVSPFLGPPGFPLLFSVMLVLPAWRSVRRGGGLAAAVLAAASVLVVAFYAASGTARPVTASGYTGLEWLLRPVVLCGVIGFSLVLLARRWTRLPLARALAALALAPSAIVWVQGARFDEADAGHPEPATGRARDYKEVQLWARDHTPKTALFMVDPTIYYGWREYSHRSSFGSLREWTYTSWLYNSDFRRCQEGLKRLGEFGLDVKDYLGYTPPLAGFAALSRELRRRYYAESDAWRLGLARRYGVDFFVLEKGRGAVQTGLPVAHENGGFIVLRVPAQPQSSS